MEKKNQNTQKNAVTTLYLNKKHTLCTTLKFLKTGFVVSGFMSGSCHFDRALNIEIGVECQNIFVVMFF